ncbi:MAG: pyruvate kinase [Armatimonadota bacterium]|nr:MAG: pyruvate kinase [Armatimonadota bacterium]
MMRRTRIVCTLGPATSSLRVQRALIKAGMNVARLNFSHGTHDEHAHYIASIRQLSEELGQPIGIMQDLSGPKLRVGEFADGQAHLRRGQTFTLTSRKAAGDGERVSLTFPDLAHYVRKGERIMLADGALELRVQRVSRGDIVCRVANSGVLGSHQGLNVPDTELPIPAVTDKDLDDLDFGIEHGVDWVAMSFVRSGDDLAPLRRRMRKRKCSIPIIAKIEKHEAVDALDEILEAADGLMVARGDLGVEMPLDRVPGIQKEIIRKCNVTGTPVITATQMLQSMMDSPRPTRAEVTDIANAILDGSDAVMLSGETAVGKYPVRAARMMARVAREAEELLDFEAIRREKTLVVSHNPTDAISESCVAMAHDLDAKAIICSTSSGYTARMISKNRPRTPIIAVTPYNETYQRLSLVWGVNPLLVEGSSDTDEMLARAQAAAKAHGYVKDGDLVVISAGVPVGVPGHTNLIKVQVVGE